MICIETDLDRGHVQTVLQIFMIREMLWNEILFRIILIADQLLHAVLRAYRVSKNVCTLAQNDAIMATGATVALRKQ